MNKQGLPKTLKRVGAILNFTTMANKNYFSQADIDSFHWLKFDGQNGEVLYALSGIIKVNMMGSSSGWVSLPITCTIDIPVLPAGMGLFIKYHTPSASLNSIYNKGQAINGGHAVNNCRLNFPNGHVSSNQTQLALDLAVSDTDAVLYKVGFNIIMSGYVRPIPPPPPID